MAVVDLKVVMLGKEFCGKTSLVERYLNNRYLSIDLRMKILILCLILDLLGKTDTKTPLEQHLGQERLGLELFGQSGKQN